MVDLRGSASTPLKFSECFVTPHSAGLAFFFFLLNYWIKLLFSGLSGAMGSLIEPQHPFGAGKCTGET